MRRSGLSIDAQARVLARRRLQPLASAVRRAAVDQQELDGDVELLCRQTGEHRVDVVDLVEHRDQDRNTGRIRRSAGHRSPHLRRRAAALGSAGVGCSALIAGSSRRRRTSTSSTDRTRRGLSVDQAVVRYVTALAPRVGELVLFGRLDTDVRAGALRDPARGRPLRPAAALPLARRPAGADQRAPRCPAGSSPRASSRSTPSGCSARIRCRSASRGSPGGAASRWCSASARTSRATSGPHRRAATGSGRCRSRGRTRSPSGCSPARTPTTVVGADLAAKYKADRAPARARDRRLAGPRQATSSAERDGTRARLGRGRAADRLASAASTPRRTRCCWPT